LKLNELVENVCFMQTHQKDLTNIRKIQEVFIAVL